jgi:uncharacterized lipoprotein YddW (UPF0748 family)
MDDFGLAIWSHQIRDFGTSKEVEGHAAGLAEGGVDILIPCVKNPPGAVDFMTDLADVNPEYPAWDPLKVLIDSCQSRGVKVHPWFCVFAEGENSRLLREHPELEARLDSAHRWACACRPEVQDHVLGLYRDLAERYHPDGLHLDYIRTGGKCTCGYCRDAMRDQGVDIKEVQSRDPDFEVWTQWRTSKITSFVHRLREDSSKRGMEISAAVFAGYPDSIAAQGQDWVRWAELGLIDYLFPMNYTNSLRVAVTRTVSHAALIRGKVPMWEGLGKASSASQLTTESLAAQVKGVLGAGAKGVVLFHYRAVDDGDLEAIRALRSDRSWATPPQQ